MQLLVEWSAGSTKIDINDIDFEDMTDDKKKEMLREIAREQIDNSIDWWMKELK